MDDASRMNSPERPRRRVDNRGFARGGMWGIIIRNMKNPYFRKVIIISVILSFLYTFLLIVQGVAISHATYTFSGTQSVTLTTNVDWLSDLITPITYLLGFPMIVITIVFGDSYGGALSAGIIMGYIGSLLVFVSWFIVLYVITYFYSRLKKSASLSQESVSQTPKISNRALIIVSVILAILFNVVSVAYSFVLEQSTFNQLKGPVVANIISVSPSTAKIDDTINMTMSSNVDHTSYFSVDLVKPGTDPHSFPGSLGRLWRGMVPQDGVISFVLQAENCPVYAGTSCDLPLVEATPGVYKLRFSSSRAEYTDADFVIAQ